MAGIIDNINSIVNNPELEKEGIKVGTERQLNQDLFSSIGNILGSIVQQVPQAAAEVGMARPSGIFGGLGAAELARQQADLKRASSGFQKITFTKDGKNVFGIFDPSSGSFFDSSGKELSGDVIKGIDVIRTNPETQQLERYDAESQSFISVGGGTPSKLTVRQENLLKDQFSKLDSDAIYTDARKSFSSARKIKQLAESGNPIASRTISRQLAKASGEVGRLTEQDVADFRGSRALKARFKQVVEEFKTGNFTEENKELITELANIMEQKSKKEMQSIISGKIGRLEEFGGFTRDSLDDIINREIGRIPASIDEVDEEADEEVDIPFIQGKTSNKPDALIVLSDGRRISVDDAKKLLKSGEIRRGK